MKCEINLENCQDEATKVICRVADHTTDFMSPGNVALVTYLACEKCYEEAEGDKEWESARARKEFPPGFVDEEKREKEERLKN